MLIKGESGVFALLAEILPITREGWARDAACAEIGGEPFYPEKGETGAAAKRICRKCEVQIECGDWAIRNDEWGIWSGTSREERRKIRQLPLAAA
jgi:WhiB family transcriptional regulator, redox-sensing transcriptional regulator